MRAGAEMALTVYDHPFTMISSFKYLGRVLSVSDDNCPEVVSGTWEINTDRPIASTRAGCLQRNFDPLTDLFDIVGPRTNIQKTVNTFFQPRHYPSGMLVEAYTCQMNREGPMYRDCIRWRV